MYKFEHDIEPYIGNKWNVDLPVEHTEIGYGLDNSAFLEEIVKGGEFEIIFGTDDVLVLDIDSEEKYLEYKKNLDKFYRYFEIVNIEEYFSVSGFPKRHIIITLSQNYDVLTRIILQSILGSDNIKEFYSLLRVIHCIENPIFVLKPIK